MPAPTLAELIAHERCALVLQEVQVGVVGRAGVLGGLGEAAAEVGVVANAARLAVGARTAGVRVIHCTAAGLPGHFGANRNARLFGGARREGTLDDDSARPMPEVLAEGDLVLPRYHGLSPMTGTHLDPLLRNEGISTVVVTGVSLNVAIPNLVFDAVNRSYQVVVVTDAVAGIPVEYGRQVVEYALRPLATLATTDDLLGIWAGPA